MVKIFGREPAVWVGVIEGFLALLVSWHQFGLDSEEVGAIMAVIVAAFGVYTAAVTRDTMLGVVVGLAKAVLALLLAYKVELSADQVATIIAFVTVTVGFFQRTQTSPASRASLRDELKR
jgi:hypothetical protein